MIETTENVVEEDPVQQVMGILQPEPEPEGEVEAQPEKEVQESEQEAVDQTTESEIEVQEPDATEVSEINQEQALDLIIDTDEGPKSVKDLKNSYQLLGTVQTKANAVDQQKRDLEKQGKELQSTFEAKLSDLDTTFQVLAQQVAGKWAGKNPADLVGDEVSEFQRDRMVISDAYNKVEQAKQQAHQESQAKIVEALAEQNQRLLNIFPERNDPVKAKIANNEMAEFLTGFFFNGVAMPFSKEEVQSVSDAREVAILHMAMEFAKLQKKAPAITKKVRTAPTQLKAKQAKASAGDEQTDKLFKIVKSGDRSSQTKAAEALLKRDFEQRGN